MLGRPPNRPTGTQINYSSYQAMAGESALAIASLSLVDALNTGMMHGNNVIVHADEHWHPDAVTGITSADPAVTDADSYLSMLRPHRSIRWRGKQMTQSRRNS